MVDDKKTTCYSLQLLEQMINNYKLWIDDTTRGNIQAKHTVKNLGNHFMSQQNKPENKELVARIQTELDKINTAINKSQYADEPWFLALDTIKDKIHKIKDIRNLFLGTDEISQKVFEVIDEMSEGDVETAALMLSDLYKETTCSTL
jgi:hypothetical protein